MNTMEERAKRPRRTTADRLTLAIVASLIFLSLSCSKNESADESSVPYTIVTDEKVDTEIAGVTLYLPDRSWRGYNLHCLRTEAVAILMDMDGNEVHRWSDDTDPDRGGWPHGIILENGDLITYRQDLGMLRLDWDSNILWQVNLGVHHEICPLPDGSFYVLARRTRRHRGLVLRISDIVRVDEDGRKMVVWSAFERLDDIKRALDTRSFLDTVLDSLEEAGENISELDTLPAAVHRAKTAGRPIYDYFHMNTISILPRTPAGERDNRFRAGNILTCFRNVNQIAVLDQDTMEILWAWGEGHLQWPHHPTMQPDGKILIFDNGTLRGFTRVIEFDPITGEIEWQYTGDPPGSFFTPTRGSAQRLPNGNTLICEGDKGRCFEITRDGEVVWEWYNPDIEEERRVQTYRMMRYPPELIEPLLGGPDR